MPFLGIGRGQVEHIQRGERTSPIVIIGQGLALVAVTLFGFIVIRAYIYYWDWIAKNEFHGWFAPPAIILVLGCVIVDWVLFYEIFDPNYPNPRQATETTRPLWPWSKERMKPEGDKTVINVKLGLPDMLNSLADILANMYEADDELE